MKQPNLSNWPWPVEVKVVGILRFHSASVSHQLADKMDTKPVSFHHTNWLIVLAGTILKGKGLLDPPPIDLD